MTLDDVKKIAQSTFGEMAKAVVDIEKEVIAIGGELHADAEALLLEQGSKQADLWGINLYPGKTKDMIEYTSLINIRPSVENFSQEIKDPTIRKRIENIVNNMLSNKEKNDT